MDLAQEFLEYSHETQQQMLDAVDDFLDMFPLDYFSQDSQGSASTGLESDQAKTDSLGSAARPLDKLEESVRHDSAMPAPASSENHSAEPETEKSPEFIFGGSESGDNNSLFGDSDSGEGTGASAEDKLEEPVRHDLAIPTPVSGEDGTTEPVEESYNPLFDGNESGDQSSLFGDGDTDEATGTSSANRPEEPVRASSPNPIQSGSDDEDLFEALERELEEADVDNGGSSSSGEGDAGEDTGAPSQDKSAELSRLDSAVSSPTPFENNSEEDDMDSVFGDSSENISSDPPDLPTAGDHRPTSPAPPSRQPQSRVDSFEPSRRPLALPPQRPQPAVEQPNPEDPAVRFPGLALPRRKPAAPPVASSTATPSTQPDVNPAAPLVASSAATPATQPDAVRATPVDAQSRKRARDDSPIEIEDSSPEPKAKRARKEQEKSCKCKNCQRGRKCTRVQTGPQPCTQEELEARNGAARIQLGFGSRKYGWMESNRTQERYGQLPPSQTKEAKARREAVPLPEDEVDTGIPVNSNDTTVDLRGEPSVSALQVSPPVSLLADRVNGGPQMTSSSTIIDLTEELRSTGGTSRSASLPTESLNSGISATSSRTTIDLTGESTPAQKTSPPASLTPEQSKSGASAIASSTTIDLTVESAAASTDATSSMQKAKERLAGQTQTEKPVSTPAPNRPAAIFGKSFAEKDFLRQQMEAMEELSLAYTAEHRSYQARGYLTDVAIDFSGPEGVYQGRRQMKRDMDMNNRRAMQRL